MFAKVFEQIFDSSIATDYTVRHMFIDLLILADPTGAVDMTPDAIARRTNVPQETVERAIHELCQPDVKSRSPLEDGKRLVPLDSHRDWGWRIVNYQHYRKIRDQEARRSYFRDYQRKRRKKMRVVKDNKVDRADRVESSSSTSSSVSVLKKKRKSAEKEIPLILRDIPGFEKEWSAFIEVRKAKRAPLTPRASELIFERLSERPQDAVNALQIAIVQNWTGFKWEWYDKQKWRAPYYSRPKERAPSYPKPEPAREPSQEELQTAAEIAKRETEKLRQSLRH